MFVNEAVPATLPLMTASLIPGRDGRSIANDKTDGSSPAIFADFFEN